MKQFLSLSLSLSLSFFISFFFFRCCHSFEMCPTVTTIRCWGNSQLIKENKTKLFTHSFYRSLFLSLSGKQTQSLWMNKKKDENDKNEMFKITNLLPKYSHTVYFRAKTGIVFIHTRFIRILTCHSTYTQRERDIQCERLKLKTNMVDILRLDTYWITI